MNLRWLKQNLMVVIFVTVFLVVLAVFIVIGQRAVSRKKLLEENLAQQQAELARLQNLDPTPAPENIEALRRERELVQHLYEQLQSGAFREPVPVPELQRDIEFSQLMRDNVGRLAAEASRNGIKIPDNFAFGFSRYDTDFPCRHPAAKADECQKILALLAKQLLVVDKLSVLLIQSRVEAITGIRRTEVEPGTPSGDALPVPIGDDPKALYKTYPFELEFTCDPDALRSFLNGLTKSDWLFAVRSVKIDSTAVAGTAAGGETEPAAGETARAPERRLLTVVVRVDLVEFERPAQTPAKKAS